MFNFSKYLIELILSSKNQHLLDLRNERDYLREENDRLQQRISFLLRIPVSSVGSDKSVPVNEKSEIKINPVGHSGVQASRLRHDLSSSISNAGKNTKVEDQKLWAEKMEGLRASKENRTGPFKVTPDVEILSEEERFLKEGELKENASN